MSEKVFSGIEVASTYLRKELSLSIFLCGFTRIVTEERGVFFSYGEESSPYGFDR